MGQAPRLLRLRLRLRRAHQRLLRGGRLGPQDAALLNRRRYEPTRCTGNGDGAGRLAWPWPCCSPLASPLQRRRECGQVERVLGGGRWLLCWNWGGCASPLVGCAHWALRGGWRHEASWQLLQPHVHQLQALHKDSTPALHTPACRAQKSPSNPTPLHTHIP